MSPATHRLFETIKLTDRFSECRLNQGTPAPILPSQPSQRAGASTKNQPEDRKQEEKQMEEKDSTKDLNQPKTPTITITRKRGVPPIPFSLEQL